MNINVKVNSELTIDVANYAHYIPRLKQSKVGVYVFYDKYKQPIYVGKTKNMNKRIPSHINGKSNVPQLKIIAKYCVIHFIENYAMADIYETVLINELKPLFNIDKATYSEFVQRVDEGLYEIEEEIREIDNEILELQLEIEEVEDIGEVFVIQRELKESRHRKAELEYKASIFKRRGGRPLENRTVEEYIHAEKQAKSAAFLSTSRY